MGASVGLQSLHAVDRNGDHPVKSASLCFVGGHLLPYSAAYLPPSSPLLHPMKPTLKAATRVQERVENWFWRFILIGVICDFL